jgi:hypothetical protein
MDFPDVKAVLDYKNVQAYLAKAAPKANWNAAIVNVALIAVFMGIWSILQMLLAPKLLGMLPGIPAGSMAAIYGSPSAMALKTILQLAGGFIVFFLTGGILHLIAKALGGKGSLMQLIYLMSLVSLVLTPLIIILSLLAFIPCVGCIICLVVLVFAVYIYYLYYLILKMVYGLSSGKAIMALAGLIVLCIIIGLVFVGIYILLFGIHSIFPALPA